MEQKHYWDKVAYDKEFTTGFRMNVFKQYVHIDNRILDYGCGYGRTLNQLFEAGYTHLIGVDFSEQMIKRGRSLWGTFKFEIIESGRLPYEDDSFDAVVLIAVLTCIPDDIEQIKVIEEIKRVLKSNGVIYINDFLLNEDERNVSRYQKFSEKYENYGTFELKEGVVVRHHDTKWIDKISSSFEDLYYEPTVYTTMNGNRSNGFVYMGRNIE
ncbi:class I SAM-dependent methyltransferase [Clostridiaceae bacterium M8S5]|nr:class I SAM-dependent methyltransferase [Clostridiaceae bacterium M8S5]